MDPDGIDTVFLSSVRPGAEEWEHKVMSHSYLSDEGLDVYETTYKILLPDLGTTVYYIFKFQVTDALGHGITSGNITRGMIYCPTNGQHTDFTRTTPYPIFMSFVIFSIGISIVAIVLILVVVKKYR